MPGVSISRGKKRATIKSDCSDEDMSRFIQQLLVPGSLIEDIYLADTSQLIYLQDCLFKLHYVKVSNINWKDRNILRSILTDPRCTLGGFDGGLISGIDRDEAKIEFLREIVTHPNFSLRHFDFASESFATMVYIRRMMEYRRENALVRKPSLFDICVKHLENASLTQLPIPLLIPVIKDKAKNVGLGHIWIEMCHKGDLNEMRDLIHVLTSVLGAVNCA